LYKKTDKQKGRQLTGKVQIYKQRKRGKARTAVVGGNRLGDSPENPQTKRKNPNTKKKGKDSWGEKPEPQ